MVIIDGEPRESLPVDDLALAAGYAVFETMRTYGRQAFRVDEHLDRLEDSARFCRVLIPDRSALRAEIGRAIDAIPTESRVNVTLTGSGRRIVRSRVLDTTWVGREMRVVTRAWTPPPWLPGWVKHTSRLPWWLAAGEADEALWVAPEGVWTECTQSNVFVVRDGVLWTPPDDGRILRGVTRTAMIAAAGHVGIEVRAAPVHVGPTDEFWLASTLKELAPVVEIDGIRASGGGPVGEAVRAEFRRAAADWRAEANSRGSSA